MIKERNFLSFLLFDKNMIREAFKYNQDNKNKNDLAHCDFYQYFRKLIGLMKESGGFPIS